MKERKKKNVGLTLACILASQQTDNFPDSIVKSAELFKDLTGEDIGIKSLRETRDSILKKVNKKWYQFWK